MINEKAEWHLVFLLGDFGCPEPRPYIMYVPEDEDLQKVYGITPAYEWCFTSKTDAVTARHMLQAFALEVERSREAWPAMPSE